MVSCELRRGVRARAASGGGASGWRGSVEGARATFDLPLDPAAGTDFQRAVWRAVARIPYGTTISYGELARRIGRPGHVRAAGGANARNPLPIVVPCHRVVGARGDLTGYSGGLARKRALLALEAAHGDTAVVRLR